MTTNRQGPGGVVRLFGFLLTLIGVGLLAAGGYLAAIGGSWYYVLAGIGMAVTGLLLIRGSASALWVYAAVVLGPLAWAVGEVGLDWWQLAARGDVVFIIGAVLLLPPITRRLGSAFGGPRSA